MIRYFLLILLTAFVTAVITEHLVIERLQLSPGTEIIAGRCRLSDGYGKI